MPPVNKRRAPPAPAALQGTPTLSGARSTPAPAPKAATSVFTLEVILTHYTIGYLANVLHFQPDQEPVGDIFDICKDLITAFEDRSQDQLLACIGADVTLSGYRARRLQGGSPTAFNDPRLPGLASQPIDNTALAVNIDLVPIEAPWQYGHFYLGGIPDDAMMSNGLVSTYLAKVATLAQTLIDDATAVQGLGITWTPVIYSRKLDTGRIIGRYIVQTKPTSLSRRLKPYAG